MRLDLPRLFINPDGRIGRLQWWIGTTILLVIEIVGLLALDPNWLSLDAAATGPTSLMETLWSLAFIGPNTILLIKRLADCNWPRWLAVPAMLPYASYLVGDHLGYFSDEGGWSSVEHAIGIAAVLVLVITSIINIAIRGTRGPNSYGPDPLST